MLILGIESSCDDTSAAVIEDSGIVLSNVLASQNDIHNKYGGIVPELASRRHIEMIIPVVEGALDKAGVTMDDIDSIGVTQGPGLVGSILIGLTFAKALSYTLGKPFVGVNHIEAHALSAFLREKGEEKAVPEFPFVSLVVSGGHTSLYSVRDYLDIELLGETRDDAAGEAFDKVSKLMGLGYPGGPIIDKLAKEGNPKAVQFTRPYMETGSLDFSFSGLKTAALNEIRSIKELTDEKRKDLSASFQEAVVDVLVKKAFWAIDRVGARSLSVAGGVACNSRLRDAISKEGAKRGVAVFLPPPKYCTDNAAMIAALAYHRLKAGERATVTLNAEP